MKKLFLILVAAIGMLGISCHADSKSKSIVPNQYLEAIEKADSVTVLLIDPWSDALDDWMDGYGEVLQTKTCACPELLQASTKALCNPDAFVASEVVKNCAFMPDVAMIYHSKKG